MASQRVAQCASIAASSTEFTQVWVRAPAGDGNASADPSPLDRAVPLRLSADGSRDGPDPVT